MMTLRDLLAARYGPDAPRIDVDPVPETIELMLRHRSCRDYSDRPVPSDLVSLILAAGLSAPSKSDLQQLTVIWLIDPDQRTRVIELSPANQWSASAPELLVFCADGRRIRRAAARLGRPFPNNHLDQFMNAAVDCGIALSATIHAAASLGLATCPISELRNQAGRLIELLDLPEFVVPVAGLALGYPAGQENPIVPRFPFDVRVQHDRYSDESFDRCFEGYEHSREPGWAETRTQQYAEPHRTDWGSHVRGRGFGLD